MGGVVVRTGNAARAAHLSSSDFPQGVPSGACFTVRVHKISRGRCVKSFSEITDEEWMRVAALLAEFPASKKGKKPQRLDRRGAFNGVLWVLRTGSPWNAMPTRFPFHDTCRLCFWAWADSGVLERAVDTLAIPGAHELRTLIGQRIAARRHHERDRFSRLHRRDGKLVWYLRCLMDADRVVRDRASRD
jgi:transposase